MVDTFLCATIFIYRVSSQFVDIWYDEMRNLNGWTQSNGKVRIMNDYHLSNCYSCNDYSYYYAASCPNDWESYVADDSEYCVELFIENSATTSIFRQTDISYYESIRLQFDVSMYGIQSNDNCNVYCAYDVIDNKTLLHSSARSTPMAPYTAYGLKDVVIDLPYYPQSTLVWIFLEAVDGGIGSTFRACMFDDVYLKGTYPQTTSPSNQPTASTKHPSAAPTKHPSVAPTKHPSVSITSKPSFQPLPPLQLYPNPTSLPSDAPLTQSSATNTYKSMEETKHHEMDPKANPTDWLAIILYFIIGSVCIAICVVMVLFMKHIYFRKKNQKPNEMQENQECEDNSDGAVGALDVELEEEYHRTRVAAKPVKITRICGKTSGRDKGKVITAGYGQEGRNYDLRNNTDNNKPNTTRDEITVGDVYTNTTSSVFDV